MDPVRPAKRIRGATDFHFRGEQRDRLMDECDLIDDTIRMFCSTVNPNRIIRNGGATVVFWDDGNKTVVKCHGEGYDAEKGLAMALARKVWGRSGTMRLVKSIEEQGAGR